MNCLCGRKLMSDRGNYDSPMAIVIDSPMLEDFQKFSILSGKVGDALDNELAKVGMQLSALHLITLNGHAVTKECQEPVIDRCVAKLQKKTAVMFMGTSAFLLLTEKKASDYSGIVVKSPLLKAKIIPAPNAFGLITGALGEYRYAIQTFASQRR